ncbi:MAG: acyl-[acyl-carrier-protein] thioesterase [Treponema sp.]|nr:acyl-[acyl-carrier-protein] thioesterase [Candidatus Treponema scatequi]
MTDFKNFFTDDGTGFCAETKVLFGQCGSDKRLHLTELMEYCADNVTEMYAQKGQDRQKLNDDGYVQMVSRSSIHINELPEENEIMTVKVREEKPEGFQLMRYYEFVSSSGKVLVQGKSLWVIVEPETRRIVSPDKFEYLIKSEVQTDFGKKPGKIKVPEELEHLGDQRILLSHLDPNGHLTNAKYINFAMDFLPEDYQKKEITDFRLNFCKEIKKNEIMHVYGAFDEENHKIIVVGKRDIPDSEGKTESSFECEIFYK